MTSDLHVLTSVEPALRPRFAIFHLLQFIAEHYNGHAMNLSYADRSLVTFPNVDSLRLLHYWHSKPPYPFLFVSQTARDPMEK